MSGPLHSIEDPRVLTRRLRELERAVIALTYKLNSLQSERTVLTTGADIDSGALAERGSAEDGFPRFYLVHEPTYAELFVTFPTAAAGSPDWLTLRKYVF